MSPACARRSPEETILWLTSGRPRMPTRRSSGLDILKPAANDVLQCWPVSRRVNSSRAPDDDASLIEAVAVSEGGDVQLLV